MEAEPQFISPEALPPRRFVGIDLGAETLKLVELEVSGPEVRWLQRQQAEHHKEPMPCLLELLKRVSWAGLAGAAVSGRLSRLLNLARVPTKQAQARGFRFLYPNQPATIVSIGSHGFSVLELRANGLEVFRENSRCSQGTGNFLRQLVERFSLSIEEASALAAGVEKSAPLSGRCPVILKTDMTHLANKGENRAPILAGLFDAVCENVLVLIKPGLNPPDVFLTGGVSLSARVTMRFKTALNQMGMTLHEFEPDVGPFLEALGAALIASAQAGGVPSLDELVIPKREATLRHVAGLAESLPQVRRMPAPARSARNGSPADVLLGFDIGSTGSKLAAIDAEERELLWQAYRRTGGDPVGAAQALLSQYLVQNPTAYAVRAFGVTGSGREIVGSLLATCYGGEAVYVLNEIAAHAEGAVQYDPRVDTIFEIGGQDAKYIRLAGGRVVDCAMNEACSAGTGSFIEEQGGKFPGIGDVSQLGKEALAAPCGVSLGQHCSVFMAEVIDESVAGGIEPRAIIAGLYDSIVQNYLHRVKGNRSVGHVIFCQGMPFSADALAAAVARQTGSQVIVPPNPGLVGALGIALLAAREVAWKNAATLDPNRFLNARIEHKETFICQSKTGCGGAGNKCRIDSIKTIVDGQRQRFSWGGACSLYDKGTRKRKLPDLTPDPFREREELLQRFVATFKNRPGHKRVALSDEFSLKGLFPFMATFLYELGLDLAVMGPGDQKTLKDGIQTANVPFCAPMQLFHGLAGMMRASSCDFVFLPRVRELPRCAHEPEGVVCPIVQASPDVLRWDLDSWKRAEAVGPRILSPVVNLGPENLTSPELLESCERLAAELGQADPAIWRRAHAIAQSAQTGFEMSCFELGRRALRFCAQGNLPAVIVVGRPYTIYNKVLNSNVPAILREQGALAIPIDCYPVALTTPVFQDVYWGHGQRILRAAHQIRRTPGVYGVYCSNYSCGPDSFNLHFFSYLMEGKPFAVIETDGHAGDAGTKTRIEAFLHCVAEDRKKPSGSDPNDFTRHQLDGTHLGNIRPGEKLLIPRLGPGSEVVTVCLRGIGLPAETLPEPDAECVRLGRRHTSGKECVPMCMTLGTLLKRLDQEQHKNQRYVLVMPRTRGPCRFGVYNLLNSVIFERLGWHDRFRIWSPLDSNYFKDTPPGFAALVLAGFMASDLLLECVQDVRPVETTPGAAQAIYERHWRELQQLLEKRAAGSLAVPTVLWEVLSGELFGIAKLLDAAARDFRNVRGSDPVPTVLVTGEIYVRCNDAANDFIIGNLEKRGCRARLVPFHELLEYNDHIESHPKQSHSHTDYLKRFLRHRIAHATADRVAQRMQWPPRISVQESLAAAAPYLSQELHGEAVLTLGSALVEWRRRQIDAVVNVGPLECMPSKIAEAQFFHIAEEEGLLSLTLPFNGDPIDPDLLDNFVFEVKTRFTENSGKTRRAQEHGHSCPLGRGER